jgi:hypothetical protein
MTKLIYVGEATIIKFTWLFISYNLIIIICCCQNTANTMILWIFFTRMFISCDLVLFLFFWPKYNFNQMIWRKFSEYFCLFVSCFQEIGTITLQIFLVYNINYKFWVSEWLKLQNYLWHYKLLNEIFILSKQMNPYMYIYKKKKKKIE